MLSRIRKFGLLWIVLLLVAAGYAVTMLCWDKVVIRLVDKRIQGYSQDEYPSAMRKIRRADVLIGHIHKDKRQNAERLRNEGRRYLLEVEAHNSNEVSLAFVRMKYHALRDLEYGNVPRPDIASCLAGFSEKGAHLYGHQMRLEDLKVLANRGQVDESKVAKETKKIEKKSMELESNKE